MKNKNLLITIATTIILTTGCVIRTVYVQPSLQPISTQTQIQPPQPAPLTEVIYDTPMIGCVWQTGYWILVGNVWVWEPGCWYHPLFGFWYRGSGWCWNHGRRSYSEHNGHPIRR